MKKNKTFGLFPKFLAGAALAALPPILLLGVLVYGVADRRVRAYASDYYLAVTDDVALILDRSLEQAGTGLDRAAAALGGPGRRKARLEWAAGELAAARCEPWLLVFGTDGTLLETLQAPDKPFPFPKRETLGKEALAGAEGASGGGVVYPQAGGFPRLRLVRKWRGGWVEGYYDLRQVSRYIVGVSGRRFHADDALSLVSADGRIVGGADEDAVLEKRELPDFARVSALAPGNAASQSFAVAAVASDSGGEWLSFYSPLPRHGLGVAIRDRRERVFAALIETRRLVFGAAGLAAALAVGLAFLFTRGLIRRIDVFVAGIKEMAGSGRPGLQVDMPAGDEIGDLAEAFNHMSAELAARLEEVAKVRLEEEKLKHTLDVARLVVEALPGGVVLSTVKSGCTLNRKARELLRGAPGGRLPRELLAPGEKHEVEFKQPDGQTVTLLATSTEVNLAGEKMRLVTFTDVCELKKVQTELAVARDAALDLARYKGEFLAGMSHEIRTPLQSIIGYAELMRRSGKMPEVLSEMLTGVLKAGDVLLAIINNILDFSRAEAGRMALEETDFSVREVVEDVGDILEARAAAKGIELVTVVEDGVPPRLLGDPERLKQALMNLAGNAVKFTEKGHVELRAAAGGGAGDNRLELVFTVSDTGIGFSEEERAKLFKSFSQADISTPRKYGGSGLGLALAGKIFGLMEGVIEASGAPGKGAVFTARARFRLPPAGLRPQAAGPLDGLRALAAVPDNALRGAVDYYLSHSGAAPAASPRDAGLYVADASVPDWREGARAWRQSRGAPRAGLVLLGRLDQRPEQSLPENAGIFFVPKPVKPAVLLRAAASAAAWGQGGAPAGEEREAAGRRCTPRARVLVAEDNPINRGLMVTLLGQGGYEVVTAVDGRRAVEEFRTDVFDLILMDCEMPELDGFGATAEIRALEAGRGHIPIIALTASYEPENRGLCLRAGMDDFLSKPVKLKDLEEMLAKWLAPRPTPPEAGKRAGGGGRAQVCQEDEYTLRESLLRAFAADSPGKVLELEIALEARDPRRLRALAHYMRGAALQAGLMDISAACARLEKCCANGVEGAEEDVAFLRKAVAAAAVVVPAVE